MLLALGTRTPVFSPKCQLSSRQYDHPRLKGKCLGGNSIQDFCHFRDDLFRVIMNQHIGSFGESNGTFRVSLRVIQGMFRTVVSS